MIKTTDRSRHSDFLTQPTFANSGLTKPCQPQQTEKVLPKGFTKVSSLQNIRPDDTSVFPGSLSKFAKDLDPSLLKDSLYLSNSDEECDSPPEHLKSFQTSPPQSDDADCHLAADPFASTGSTSIDSLNETRLIGKKQSYPQYQPQLENCPSKVQRDVQEEDKSPYSPLPEDSAFAFNGQLTTPLTHSNSKTPQSEAVESSTTSPVLTTDAKYPTHLSTQDRSAETEMLESAFELSKRPSGTNEADKAPSKFPDQVDLPSIYDSGPYDGCFDESSASTPQVINSKNGFQASPDTKSTSDALQEIIDLAGKSLDDNPKLWSKLRSLLQAQQETLHEQTLKLSDEKRRVRQLEDELVAAKDQLVQLDRQLQGRHQYEHDEEGSKSSTSGYKSIPKLIETSSADTLAAAASVAEAYAVAKSELNQELERRQKQLDQQEATLQSLRQTVGLLESKAVEYETEREYLEKERDMWCAKAKQFQAAEQRAMTEIAKLKTSFVESRQDLEKESGDMIAHLKKTVAKLQNRISVMEETIALQHQHERTQEDLHAVDMKELMKSKEQVELQLAAQTHELEELKRAEAQYRQHLKDHTALLQTYHETEMTALTEQLEIKKEAMKQLQISFDKERALNKELRDVQRALSYKYENQNVDQTCLVNDYIQALDELREQFEKEKAVAKVNQEECAQLQEEVDMLRKDCRRLQRLLKERTTSMGETIEQLKHQLEEADQAKTQEVSKLLADKENQLKEDLDSMVELRTNQRLELIKSRYEKKIAKLKHQLMHTHSIHLRPSELRKFVAAECAKLTGIPKSQSKDRAFGSTCQAIGSAMACHWPSTSQTVDTLSATVQE